MEKDQKRPKPTYISSFNDVNVTKDDDESSSEESDDESSMEIRSFSWAYFSPQENSILNSPNILPTVESSPMLLLPPPTLAPDSLPTSPTHFAALQFNTPERHNSSGKLNVLHALQSKKGKAKNRRTSLYELVSNSINFKY
jgi:hypothetical protein